MSARSGRNCSVTLRASDNLAARAKRLHVEPDMVLPEGKACRDCVHLARCVAIFGGKPEREYCDWSPSRFHEKAASP